MPQKTKPASTEEDQEDEDLPVLDSSREEVREATEWVARGVDSWFGNKPFEEGGKVTKGRIRTRVVWREHDEVDFNLRFRVSMRLPNLQDKAYVLIGSIVRLGFCMNNFLVLLTLRVRLTGLHS